MFKMANVKSFSGKKALVYVDNRKGRKSTEKADEKV
jgi:hypothetical protein